MPTHKITSALTSFLAIALLLALLGAKTTPEHSAAASTPAPTPAASPTSEPEPTKPNIVVVMADDMRADDLRFMPAVDELITDRGLKFSNAFSPFPLCCPARSSFLSGQFAHNTKVYDNNKPFGFGSFDDSRTLATSLRKAGYRTAFVGKYLNAYGIDRSKVTGEHSWNYVPPGWTDWYATVQRPERLKEKYPSGGTYDYFHPIFNVNGRTDDTHKGEYQTGVVGAFSRNIVHRYSGTDQPFFLFLSALAPHDGRPHEDDDVRVARRSDGQASVFRSPARPDWIKGRFDEETGRSPGLPTKADEPSEDDVTDKPPALQRPDLNESERRIVANLTRQRAESLAVLDGHVRRLVTTLRNRGELEDTVFVFTSDNGFFLGEHRIRTGKRMGYEPSIRVPLVIAGPGIPRGVRHDPATTQDVSATILDLAEAAPPHYPDGRSLVPSFTADRGWIAPVLTEGVASGPPKPRDSRQEEAGFTDPRTTIGIRTSRYKLIRDVSGTVELYDLDKDPNELTSVADDPDYADVRKELMRLWHQYKDCAAAECTAPLPPDLARTPEQVAASTQKQADGVLKRHGVTF